MNISNCSLKDKYNSKELLMANDYVELNKNNETLMIYNQSTPEIPQNIHGKHVSSMLI